MTQLSMGPPNARSSCRWSGDDADGCTRVSTPCRRRLLPCGALLDLVQEHDRAPELPAELDDRQWAGHDDDHSEKPPLWVLQDGEGRGHHGEDSAQYGQQDDADSLSDTLPRQRHCGSLNPGIVREESPPRVAPPVTTVPLVGGRWKLDRARRPKI